MAEQNMQVAVKHLRAALDIIAEKLSHEPSVNVEIHLITNLPSVALGRLLMQDIGFGELIDSPKLVGPVRQVQPKINALRLTLDGTLIAIYGSEHCL